MNRTVTPCRATASASWSGVARSSSRALAPDAEREDDQAAEAEGEPDRRGAGEDVVGLGAQHVRRERVGDGEHVAVEVHGRLGAAGGAGGEGQQGDVVGGGGDVGRTRPASPRPGWTRSSGPVEPKVAVRRPGIAAFARSSVSRASHSATVGPAHLGHRRELTGAQQRHRRHRDAAGLEDGEPAGDQPRLVEAAQQHPVAGHQPEVVDEDGGDPVGVRAELAVGPDRPVGGAQARAGPDRAGRWSRPAVRSRS